MESEMSHSVVVGWRSSRRPAVLEFPRYFEVVFMAIVLN